MALQNQSAALKNDPFIVPQEEVLDQSSPLYQELILQRARAKQIELVREKIRFEKITSIRLGLITLLSVGLMVGLFLLKKPNVDFFWSRPVLNTYSLLIVFFVLSRYVFSWIESKKVSTEAEKLKGAEAHLPTVSIVIVGKNEEQAIYKTIDNCYHTYYPQNLLEVISIDDGSTDGSLQEMMRAKKTYPTLTVAGFKSNRGKRHGMATGVELAKGEIIVFVDSDSFLEPEAIGNLVDAFRDPRVAAVSGRTDVENWKTNFLTKIQAFRYYVAFKYMKSAESLFGCVTCCPGCFSAYRKSELSPMMDTWLAQRFLGKPATFGDDRSLTTMMLRNNKRVIYKDNAVCTTLVPENWPKYLKQQVRWKKSWIRETLIASLFMWRKNPLMSSTFYMGALFPVLTPVITFNNLFYQTLWNGHKPTYYILGLLVMSGLFSCFYAAKKKDGLWIHGIAYSILYTLFLVWQMPYAFFTLRKNSWGTR